MYLEHFGLNEAPFSITPDPAFIYLSQRHRDALAHLLYGVGQGGSGGFVQLTGEVGTGKTTLCRALLEQVPEATHIALILNPLMTQHELLAAICEELGIDTSRAADSNKVLVDRLTSFLLDAHRRGERVVIVIDEAQNLSAEALEQIRLLTNLETSKEKLLQIILLGQPELRDMLKRRNLRQLAQRITARYHLTPLGMEDTLRYIKHRLRVAGARRNPFTRSAQKAVFRRSVGVPRLINIIADRALAGAYARERDVIDARLVHAAANEVQLGEPGVSKPRRSSYALAAAAALVLIVGSWYALFETGNPGPSASMSGGENPRPAALSDGVRSRPQEDRPAADDALDPGWLEDQHLRAWQGLGDAWGRPEDAAIIEAACLGRAGLGYACLRDQGNWSRIRQLGLPVVLVLQDPAGSYVLLRGIDNGKLMVGAADDIRIVSRESIDSRWFGDYLVAWPQAPDWPKVIGRGDSGAAVQTVLDLAARTDEPYRGEAEFGQDFERWLIGFQARNGLDPDGIVGPKTLLYLMRFSIEQPRLLSSLEGGV